MVTPWLLSAFCKEKLKQSDLSEKSEFLINKKENSFDFCLTLNCSCVPKPLTVRYVSFKAFSNSYSKTQTSAPLSRKCIPHTYRYLYFDGELTPWKRRGQKPCRKIFQLLLSTWKFSSIPRHSWQIMAFLSWFILWYLPKWIESVKLILNNRGWYVVKLFNSF